MIIVGCKEETGKKALRPIPPATKGEVGEKAPAPDVATTPAASEQPAAGVPPTPGGAESSAAAMQPTERAVGGPQNIAPGAALGGTGRPLTEEEINMLNYGISQFKDAKGRAPKDLKELVASRYIPRLPTLPEGEKYEYDAQTGFLQVIKGKKS